MYSFRTETSICRWYTAVNGAYYASNAAVLNFSTLYLQSLGFSNTVIGTAFALAALLSLLIQTVTAAFLDSRASISNRRVLIAGNLLLFASAWLLIPSVHRPASFFLLYILLYACALSMQQFISALAMDIRNDHIRINFGLSRGIGSVVFIAVTLAGGWILTAQGASVLPIICACIGAVSAAICYRLPFRRRSACSPSASSRGGVKAYLLVLQDHHTILPVLLAVMLVSVFTSCVSSFLIVILQDVGGEAQSLSWVQSFGTLCEIPLFLLFDRIVYKFSSKVVLLFSTFVYLLRCLLYLLAQNVWWIMGAQMLQGLSYSLFFAACIVYINEVTSDANKAKGQALMAMVSMSVGSILASVLSGVLLDALGVQFMLGFAFVCLLLGFIIMALTLVPEIRREKKRFQKSRKVGTS